MVGNQVNLEVLRYGSVPNTLQLVRLWQQGLKDLASPLHTGTFEMCIR